MSMRDLLPWRFDKRRQEKPVPRVSHEIDTNRPIQHEELVRDIVALPEDWHGAGVCGMPPLRAMELLAPQRILHSAETGCGRSTLLLSHMSQHHTVFAIDDRGDTNSLARVQESPLLRRETSEFVLGPTQQTLPRHTFKDKLQLVFIDGPHGFPFPELEYYFFYPHLDAGALFILDDIHIPSIFRLFTFLREDAMFEFVGVTYATAFFRRTAAPAFDPLGDGWWLQNYNRKRFPIVDYDEGFLPARTPASEEFNDLMRRFGHAPDTTR
jgi:hypothetical protein